MSKPIQLIIADDHKLFSGSLKNMFDTVEGINVVALAGNGKELISLLEQHPCDIVLLDINMPEMNGFEFLDALLKNKNIDCNKLKIFILTSSLNVKDKEQAGKYPILKGYLEKPLNILNFKELIQQGFNFQGYTV